MQEKQMWERVLEEIKGVRSEVTELRSDVTELRSDVNEIRTNVTELRTDVTELRSDVNEIRTNVTELRSDVDVLKVEVKDLKSSFQRFVKQFSDGFSILNKKLDRLEQKIDQHVRTNDQDKNEMRRSINELINFKDQQMVINQLLSKQIG